MDSGIITDYEFRRIINVNMLAKDTWRGFARDIQEKMKAMEKVGERVTSKVLIAKIREEYDQASIDDPENNYDPLASAVNAMNACKRAAPTPTS